MSFKCHSLLVIKYVLIFIIAVKYIKVLFIIENYYINNLVIIKHYIHYERNKFRLRMIHNLNLLRSFISC